MLNRRTLHRLTTIASLAALLPLGALAQGKDPARLRVALLPDENAARASTTPRPTAPRADPPARCPAR